MDSSITITSIPEISAIYYALLQCGYNFYTLKRSSNHIESIHTFIRPEHSIRFFEDVRQTTCEVYPYWPRAAMLETASFFLSPTQSAFFNFAQLESLILSASNISDCERDQSFWDWLTDFPRSLHEVLINDDFLTYLGWEREWVAQQNQIHADSLLEIQGYLNTYTTLCHPPLVSDISIVLNPIKCVHSSDYHLVDNHFIFCSGSFRKESIVHEYMHHVVHPIVESHKEEIGHHQVRYPGIDPSYYLAGQLNAFEEYYVRRLTTDIFNQNPPTDLHAFLKAVLEETDCHTSVGTGSQ